MKDEPSDGGYKKTGAVQCSVGGGREGDREQRLNIGRATGSGGITNSRYGIVR